jgi:predicted phage terminase large subunit-like protein
MNNVTLNDIQIELSRRDAWEFCCYMNEDFYSKREFLQVIADTYQYLIQGSETPKYIIERIEKCKYVEKFTKNPEHAVASMSPRAGKSYILSLCSAWALGKYPKESILRSSSSQKLYRKFSRSVRYFITTIEFQKVFPGIKLSSDNSDVDGWSLEDSLQGSYFGSGVDGSIIGWGASLIALTDDLYKSHNDALSEAINERTLEFMESAFDSRKEKNCNQFDIGTRWTVRDYMGLKMQEGYYDIVIRIPALDKEGKSFCEDVIPTEKYIEKRDKLIRGGQDHIWHAEYMQEPIEVKGLLFPASKLNRFKLKDLNKDNIISKISFIDTADLGDDYYVQGLGYIVEWREKLQVFIPKVIFTQDPFKITQPRTIELTNSERLENLYIETNKEGSLYLNNITKACPNTQIIGVLAKSSMSKQARIFAQSDYIIENFHFLVDEDQNDEYKAFFSNLTTYLKEGKNKHDDAPDDMAGLAKAVRLRFNK